MSMEVERWNGMGDKGKGKMERKEREREREDELGLTPLSHNSSAM